MRTPDGQRKRQPVKLTSIMLKGERLMYWPVSHRKDCMESTRIMTIGGVQ